MKTSTEGNGSLKGLWYHPIYSSHAPDGNEHIISKLQRANTIPPPLHKAMRMDEATCMPSYMACVVVPECEI